jgi:hypothetical protein
MHVPFFAGGFLNRRALTRALAVSAITAMGASGSAIAAHASTSPAAAPLKAPKPYDFNGDGYPDLALGSPYGKVGTQTTAGFVSIVYGSTSGPNVAKKQIISQSTSGVPGTPEKADHFGFSMTSLDFDQDGYADLIVGAPDEDTTAGTNAGSETILWGSKSGLTGTGSGSIGEPDGTAGANHRFGYSMTMADFDDDGYAEWVDTAPGDRYFWLFTSNPSPQQAARSAKVTSLGGTFRPAVQGRPARGVKRQAKISAAAADNGNDAFVPAVGDVNGDQKPDLILGWVDSDDAQYPSGFDVWTDLAGDDPATERLNRTDSLAVADFDGDGYADIAAGSADESGGAGGHVTIFPGSTDVTQGTTTTFTQGAAGVPGPGAAGDKFGSTLSAGDINKDGEYDLAVGVPGHTVSDQAAAGEAVVLYGSASGLTGTGSQALSQSTSGVAGAAEAGDAFGWAVDLLDVNADGSADLIAGAPKENGTDGAVSWLKGGTTVTGSGSASFGAGTLGITGKDAQVGVRIGRTG